jgi:hypothetical protein
VRAIVGSGGRSRIWLLKGDEGDEDCNWARDVWNQLIPSNMSTLVWRLFHRRLPIKEN